MNENEPTVDTYVHETAQCTAHNAIGILYTLYTYKMLIKFIPFKLNVSDCAMVKKSVNVM